jgi:hypothetical protein
MLGALCPPAGRCASFDLADVRFGLTSVEDTQMLRSTPDTEHPRKWALALRQDKEHDPYADIVGTC